MVEWYELGGALNIQSGAELEKFDLGEIVILHTKYRILTGYEALENKCWFCGSNIEQGKRKAHFCRKQQYKGEDSCSVKYHRHFDWTYASSWAMRRAGGKCENCGAQRVIRQHGWDSRVNLEVHHIVPLQGSERYFSPFNLPWNLIVLCHDCHVELHAAMKIKSIVKHIETTTTLQGSFAL